MKKHISNISNIKMHYLSCIEKFVKTILHMYKVFNNIMRYQSNKNKFRNWLKLDNEFSLSLFNIQFCFHIDMKKRKKIVFGMEKMCFFHFCDNNLSIFVLLGYHVLEERKNNFLEKFHE